MRAEALVAIFMPNQPQSPENRPAIGTPSIDSAGWSLSANRMPRQATRMTKTPATTLYCRTRYAIAPSRTACAMRIISSSPSDRFMTVELKILAINSASTAPAGARKYGQGMSSMAASVRTGVSIIEGPS